MSELDRLIEIARALPAKKVHALLAVAEQFTDDVPDEEFLRKINLREPLDVDEETATALRDALSERGKSISHKDLKRELALE